MLNSCWLAKEGEQWGVAIIPDPQTRDVRFETYRVSSKAQVRMERTPNWLQSLTESVPAFIASRPSLKTRSRGKRVASRSSARGWTGSSVSSLCGTNRNWTVPGQVQRYKSGERKGEIKTEKVTFFRPPNPRDLEALEEAKYRLDAKWDVWDAAGLIPTEADSAKLQLITVRHRHYTV